MMHADAHIRRYARLLAVLGMLVGALGWTPQAAATANCTSSSATLSMPSSVSISVNASAGPIAGATGTATINFSCSGLPEKKSVPADRTATIQAGQFLATLDSTNVSTGPGIRFATNLTGIAVLVTATPVQATSQACLACGPTSTAGYVPGSVIAPPGAVQGSYSGSVTAHYTAQLVKTIAGPITPGTINTIDLIPFWWYVPGGSAHSVSASLNTTLKLPAVTVTVPACSISAAKNFTVTLPTVSTRDLASAGLVAGRTAFSIGLSGCPSGVSKITNTFSLGSIDSATGNLKNTASAANVEIQLLNGAGGSATAFSPIALNGSTATAQNSGQFNVVGGMATLNYYAQYIATGAATSGDVASSVQYTITYP